MSANATPEMIQDAREMIALYIRAEKAVLTGQSYNIGGQSLTRADLDKIRAGRKEWENTLAKYTNSYGRVFRRIVPMDM